MEGLASCVFHYGNTWTTSDQILQEENKWIKWCRCICGFYTPLVTNCVCVLYHISSNKWL